MQTTVTTETQVGSRTVAQALNVSQVTVAGWARDGKIHGMKNGDGDWVFPLSELERVRALRTAARETSERLESLESTLELARDQRAVELIAQLLDAITKASARPIQVPSSYIAIREWLRPLRAALQAMEELASVDDVLAMVRRALAEHEVRHPDASPSSGWTGDRAEAGAALQAQA